MRSWLKSSPGVGLWRWFDSSVGYQNSGDGVKDEPSRTDWVRSLPFLGLHVSCLAVWWVGWSWTALAVTLGLYLVRMFAITGFYHRYFSHRTYSTSRAAQFLFAVLGSTAVQRGPLWWAANHRYHHQYSDKPEDIHSPHQSSFYWSHMGWVLSKSNFRTDVQRVKDLAAFSELRFLDRFDALIPALLAASLLLLGGGLQIYAPGLGTSAAQMFVWGFCISTIVLFHATCTINSLAHTLGRKRYRTGDESRNSLLLALLTLGEGWHNNHHHFPGTARQGFYWWEIDLTYYVLLLLSKLGIIWNLKGVPVSARESGRL